jgi:DNA-binding SARP family transcriptional activator/tetratricopeptide (TPR) repeat protein
MKRVESRFESLLVMDQLRLAGLKSPGWSPTGRAVTLDHAFTLAAWRCSQRLNPEKSSKKKAGPHRSPGERLLPTAARTVPSPALQLDLLGELQLCRSSGAVVLPASRKTRALLAYLAATAKRHLRSELCCLFWEDAADPRAGLRWSLTQIRHALGDPHSHLVHADRDSVTLRTGPLRTDLARLAALVSGPDVTSVSREALIEASALFRGEFLEGLDMPSCYAFHEWCMSEREAASARRERILEALVDRLADRPEQALVHARALAALNPLNENTHIQLMRVLGTLGRRDDAMAQYAQCCRIFDRELGLAPPAGIERARAELDKLCAERGKPVAHNGASVPTTRPAAPAPVPSGVPSEVASSAPGRARAPLIGRDGELAQLAACVDQAIAGNAPDVLLIDGVPGIGKSRLLDELAHRFDATGGRCLRGRAFEAEMLRPFGFWRDALRELGDGALPADTAQALRPLLRADAGGDNPGDRDSLFEAVAAALLHIAGPAPLAVLVDDLHWIEASSAALLHYVMRRLSGTAVLFALTGRTGELEDNAAAQGLIAELTRTRRLRRVALAPLADVDARALLLSVAPGVDVECTVEQARGNPLMLVELARSQGAAGASAGLLERILVTRLSRLSPGAGELLDWASVFGATVPLDVLVTVSGETPGRVGKQLSELERHGLICAAGDAGYTFSHDLIQQAAYSRVSFPRRRLMHKSIANVMSPEMQTRPQTCGEVAHHARLGGQHLLAAQASAGAGEQGLRMCANREAAEAARRGLRQTARVSDQAMRARLGMALLRIQVLATSGQPNDSLRPAVAAIHQAIEAARTSRLHTEVAQGYYLLSMVHQEAGELDAAQQATLRAADATTRSQGLERARQLANSARCLVELGRDIPRARTLIAEARTLAEAAGLHEIEVRWCSGLLYHWDGDHVMAAQEIDAAVELASAAEDHWRHCKCLAWAAVIELERCRPAQAQVRAQALQRAASRLGEGADAPLADTVDALARRMAGESAAPLDAAIDRLRKADDKSRLAWALNQAASFELANAHLEEAGTWAEHALATAEAIGEVNESIVAHVTLMRVASARGDSARAQAQKEHLRPARESPAGFSARAIRAAQVTAAASATSRPRQPSAHGKSPSPH